MCGVERGDRAVRRGVPVVVALLCGALVACSAGPVADGLPDPLPGDLPEVPELPSRQPLPNWTTPPRTSFSVVAGGDVLIHPELTEQATADGSGVRDYRPLLSGVKQVVTAADLAICHLEVPLAGPQGPFSGWPAFNSPPEVATALADAGYDACSTASNHVLDRGQEGVRSTLDVLDAAGIVHTGSARTQQEAATARVIEVNGARVGHVSFTFGFNGFRLPSGMPWLANRLDVDAVLAAARAAKGAGADVVVASLHWGNEYESQPTATQRSMARALLADDAVDLIIGHHAHVVQPFEVIGGKWVAYGLGNHVARHAEPRGTSEEGVLARFRFSRDGERWVVDRAEYIPTMVDLGPPIRLLDLTTGSGDRRNVAVQRIDRVVRALDAPVTRPGA
jgi:hypothetical protein